jgi:hypothetical protein
MPGEYKERRFGTAAALSKRRSLIFLLTSSANETGKPRYQ